MSSSSISKSHLTMCNVSKKKHLANLQIAKTKKHMVLSDLKDRHSKLCYMSKSNACKAFVQQIERIQNELESIDHDIKLFSENYFDFDYDDELAHRIYDT